MTAATTVFGLIPMAVSKANIFGMPYAPYGRVMTGGLITSTTLTLLAVPLLYTFFDDLRTMWNRLMHVALRPKVLR